MCRDCEVTEIVTRHAEAVARDAIGHATEFLATLRTLSDEASAAAIKEIRDTLTSPGDFKTEKAYVSESLAGTARVNAAGAILQAHLEAYFLASFTALKDDGIPDIVARFALLDKVKDEAMETGNAVIRLAMGRAGDVITGRDSGKGPDDAVADFMSKFSKP